jgi:hypothetical protein
LKPAAVLVRRFDIHVRGITQLGMFRENGRVADARIDPDVDGIVAMRDALGQTEFTRERDVIELEPNIRSTLRDKIRQLANPIGVQNGLAFG